MRSDTLVTARDRTVVQYPQLSSLQYLWPALSFSPAPAAHTLPQHRSVRPHPQSHDDAARIHIRLRPVTGVQVPVHRACPCTYAMGTLSHSSSSSSVCITDLHHVPSVVSERMSAMAARQLFQRAGVAIPLHLASVPQTWRTKPLRVSAVALLTNQLGANTSEVKITKKWRFTAIIASQPLVM